MLDFADRQISQLSGGQQQRVFLARALVQDAQVYFMDEPFQGVDATTERAIVALLQDLRAAGKTVVAVHHDLQTVADYFDSVTLLMYAGLPAVRWRKYSQSRISGWHTEVAWLSSVEMIRLMGA